LQVDASYPVCQNDRMSTKTVRHETAVLRALLNEVRLLRSELTLILPTEKLSGYAHPRRISGAYRRALKAYPVRK